MEPHEVLGVPADADDAQVRAAYRRLVREHHPDRHAGGSAAEQEAAARRMAEVTEAYQLLSDPDAMTRRRLRTHWASGTGAPPPPAASPDPGTFDYRRAAPSEFTAGPSGRWGQTPPTPSPPPAPDRRRGRGANRAFVWLLVVTVAILAAVVILG